MQTIALGALAALALASASASPVAEQSALGTFSVRRQTLLSGTASAQQAGNWRLRATLGQAEAGPAASGAAWRLSAGYWPGLPPQTGDGMFADGFE
ncbi:MAG: hypothetical protein AMXMBFR25_01600 [Lysobacterales bacterium]